MSGADLVAIYCVMAFLFAVVLVLSFAAMGAYRTGRDLSERLDRYRDEQVQHNKRYQDCDCLRNVRARGNEAKKHTDGAAPGGDRLSDFRDDISGPFWPAGELIDAPAVVQFSILFSSPSDASAASGETVPTSEGGAE